MPPQIAGFDDLTEVGRGGFGTVYAATDHRFGRKVAIKVIRDHDVGRNVAARFERECLALGSLSGHPNIVAVHDQGVDDDGHLYLVMEFLGGGSFADRLAAHGRVAPADVASWGASLAGALETAHRAGIVHRDVKPENILFSDYGVPKLVDFGIARMRSAYQTRTGSVSATLMHAAPEIVAGGSISPSADVYSLSSVLFTLLVGHAPFQRDGDETIAPLIARIVTAKAPDLEGTGVPPELAAVVTRALGKQPGERFESAGDFGAALRDCARSLGVAGATMTLGDDAEVARAAETVTVDAPGPVSTPDPGLTVDVPRDAPGRVPRDPHRDPALAPTVDEPVEPTGRRRWPVAIAVVVGVTLVGGGAVALNSRGPGASADTDRAGSAGGDGTSTTTATPPPVLPVGTIRTGKGCTGFACTFTVTSPTPLPAGAEWRWSVDDKPLQATGPTLERTFERAGTRVVSVVAGLDGRTSRPATVAVDLRSWTPGVEVASTNGSSTRGTVTVTVRPLGHPECVPPTAQLQVDTGQGFEDLGRPVEIGKDATGEVDVDRGRTYRAVVASRDVRNAVCERVVSAETYVALQAATTGSTTGGSTTGGSTTGGSTTGGSTTGGGTTGGTGGGNGPSTLPPIPNP